MQAFDNEATPGKRSQQDDFEQWLTGQLLDRQPYLGDQGFSNRVMAGIPAASHTRHVRTLLWATLLALGCVIGLLVLFPGWPALFNLATAILTLPLPTLLQIGLGVGLGIIALGTFAIWRET